MPSEIEQLTEAQRAQFKQSKVYAEIKLDLAEAELKAATEAHVQAVAALEGERAKLARDLAKSKAHFERELQRAERLITAERAERIAECEAKARELQETAGAARAKVAEFRTLVEVRSAP